ncbi:hypothetical protein ACMD2_22285 [Ananas comosus]|uniref:Uncharacterized protein n=1 Tax=Ananas comosus TaxID=4615 RepID=A0A199UEA0_ANACO|nr:hypothetical protein ACMD2_22285 [Ananas comosus]
MQRRRAMTWTSVGRSAQAVVAHGLLFCFTLFLALKIDRRTSYSWWITFAPLWLFHAVVARGRFSLPAPSLPHGRHWAPCHAIVATPLLVAFELLLCIYLQSISVGNHPAVNLKIVFLPLLAFEIIILVDNFRMCRALMPGDEESMSDETIWETLPWSNPMIHKRPHHGEGCSSSTAIRYRDWDSGLVLPSLEEHEQDRLCGLQDIEVMEHRLVLDIFQYLHSFRHYSFYKRRLFFYYVADQRSNTYLMISSRVQDCFAFLHHGSRLLGWWSIDEGSKEEQAPCFMLESTGMRKVLVQVILFGRN